jgi:hypothetical protein
MGRGSSVSISTRYGMDGPGIEYRWGRGFPHPSRPGMEPTPSYRVGTRSFPGVKLEGNGVDHAPPSSAEFKERVELYLRASSAPLRQVNFTFLSIQENYGIAR